MAAQNDKTRSWLLEITGPGCIKILMENNPFIGSQQGAPSVQQLLASLASKSSTLRTNQRRQLLAGTAQAGGTRGGLSGAAAAAAGVWSRTSILSGLWCLTSSGTFPTKPNEDLLSVHVRVCCRFVSMRLW